MDINATSILNYQIAAGRQQMGQAMMKQTIEGEKQVADAILNNAVQAIAAADGSRGNNLDVMV